MKHKLPDDVVAIWPEVLGDIDVKYIPIEYIQTIHVTLKNKKIWFINLMNKKKSEMPEVEKNLTEFFEQNENFIEEIDFKLNIDKIKKDVTKNTNRFLKRIKGSK